MDPLSRLDELYAVSDLHLGGSTGFQIFDQGTTLAGLIDALREREPRRTVGLVLNGDIVDFLSEEGGSGYLRPDTAVVMLERIFRDPAFAPVWAALSRFVRTARRHLILVLGNHDVELALPRVQERLLAELCGDDEGARGRVRTAMDGAGFTCQVGRARALCMHGNEVDAWNLIDYEALRKVARAQNTGQVPEPWDPNAGTQLVMDVMNGVKRRHPFVDLLKPETKVVPGILLALEPGLVTQLARLAPVAYRLARGTAKQSGFLSADADAGAEGGARRSSTDAQAAVIEQFLGSSRAGSIDTSAEAMRLYAAAEEDFRRNLLPMQLAAQSRSANETLGLGQYVWDRLTGQPPQEALRMALLDWLKDDHTFDLDTGDGTFEALDQAAGPGVDFVLAGHTHLARALPRKGQRGFYFNSGTWIRLIRLTGAMLADEDTFKPAYQAITAGSMAALDAAEVPVRDKDGSPTTQALILRRPTVIRLVDGPGGTTGDLAQARLLAGKVSFVPEAKTQFVRS